MAIRRGGSSTGGADLLLIETIFDTLNAKAAIFACEEVMAERGLRLPLMISGTITDRSGRTLFRSDADRVLALGAARPSLLGRPQLRAWRKRDARASQGDIGRRRRFCVRLSQCRTAERLRADDESPEAMAAQIGEFAAEGLVNIVGGCCGSTPEHIRAIAEAVRRFKPRTVPAIPPLMRLSALSRSR